MPTLAVLSLHTSPLVQPGAGDSGGMNVYVRELASSLAQAGVSTEVFVRRWRDDLPDVVPVEPGFRVVHVPAGPVGLAKEELPGVLDEFTERTAELLAGRDISALHANYWLSGVVGHRLKHALELPLVSTFHTLARVKADSGDPEPEARERAEGEVIGCSDAVLASCDTEAHQLEHLYEADPSRIEIVPPGVDHAFFSPGEQAGARQALGLGPCPVLLFVGRIQPLKGLDVAIEALHRLPQRDAVLVVGGGSSGADGNAEVARVRAHIAARGPTDRVRILPAVKDRRGAKAQHGGHDHEREEREQVARRLHEEELAHLRLGEHQRHQGGSERPGRPEREWHDHRVQRVAPHGKVERQRKGVAGRDRRASMGVQRGALTIAQGGRYGGGPGGVNSR